MIQARDYRRFQVSDPQIFEFYIGEKVDLTRLYCNPIRADNNPTAGFFESRNDTLMFHDFGTGQT